MTYKKIMLVMWATAAAMPAAAGWAQSHAETGLVQGAIGGAVVGQIIGRDTRSTLLGGAMGGVLGLMIGNARDPYPPTAAHYRYADERPRYRPTPVCRDTEMIAYVNGRPERVWGQACLVNGAWVRQDNYRPGERIVMVERPRMVWPPVVFAYRQPAPEWGRACPPRPGHARDDRDHGGRRHRSWAGSEVAWQGHR